jgi:hypothetical protein
MRSPTVSSTLKTQHASLPLLIDGEAATALAPLLLGRVFATFHDELLYFAPPSISS